MHHQELHTTDSTHRSEPVVAMLLRLSDELADEMSDIRYDRVEELKERISSGRYRPIGEDVAAALIS